MTHAYDQFSNRRHARGTVRYQRRGTCSGEYTCYTVNPISALAESVIGVQEPFQLCAAPIIEPGCARKPCESPIAALIARGETDRRGSSAGPI